MTPFYNRGLIGLPFDVADTLLAYQGLPTATAYKYMASDWVGSEFTGHSLGSADAANLRSWGMTGDTYGFALPFGNIAPAGMSVAIGDGDIINGFSLGKIFNWGADVREVPFITGHPCSNYVGCGSD